MLCCVPAQTCGQALTFPVRSWPRGAQVRAFWPAGGGREGRRASVGVGQCLAVSVCECVGVCLVCVWCVSGVCLPVGHLCFALLCRTQTCTHGPVGRFRKVFSSTFCCFCRNASVFAAVAARYCCSGHQHLCRNASVLAAVAARYCCSGRQLATAWLAA